MKCCTLATLSHIHRAKVMAKSWKNYYPDVPLVLCLVEQTNRLDLETSACFDDIILAKDLGSPHFLQMMFGYQANEAACSLKSDLLRYMLKRYPEEQAFMYLDSDIKLYSRLLEVEEALQTHKLVLTPHMLDFPPKIYIDFFGIYNTGFLAIHRSQEIDLFLEWWGQKLQFQCYISHEQGIFLDQTWLNIAPSLVDTYVCNHPGYNLSFWNAHESMRQFSSTDTCMQFSNGSPLRFIHFSRLADDFATMVHQSPVESFGVWKHLYQNYMTELEQCGLWYASHAPWSYDFTYDGTKIESKTKENYRLLAEKQIPHDDPFLPIRQPAAQHFPTASPSNRTNEEPLVLIRNPKPHKKSKHVKRKLRSFVCKKKSRNSKRYLALRKMNSKRCAKRF